jgi:hypothetical protein
METAAAAVVAGHGDDAAVPGGDAVADGQADPVPE